MAQYLKDVQPTLERFLVEAETCAKQELGFAAISTALSIILAVGETFHQTHTAKRTKDRDRIAIKHFVKHMRDRAWYVKTRSPKSDLSDEELSIILAEVRNGIAHQLSLPLHIGMVNNKEQLKAIHQLGPNVLDALCVQEFVHSVRAAVADIVEQRPTAVLDFNSQNLAFKRAPAERYTTTLPSGQAVGASAAKTGSSEEQR
jgi:hypothetical protein